MWRAEAPHVLAALLRRSGDIEACEDAVQEALVAAAEQWPRDGQPDNPRAWLIRVASRRHIDQRRSDAARAQRELRASSLEPADREDAAAPGASELDDTLQMLTLCCHPALSAHAQVALTLRAVAGLTTAQIAAGFLVPEATMAQRISRAKRALKAAGARFGAPTMTDLPQRLHAVRHVLYLTFNEGHTASAGSALVDTTLAGEAIRLAERLHRAVPDDTETTGLLALMLLTDARAPARIDEYGDLVPLAEQDRTQWDGEKITRGTALVEEALPTGLVGPFQIQAAIAAVHGEAPTSQETDWLQITMLYRMLDELAPSPVVSLNLAIAVGMAHGPAAGLDALEPLLQSADQQRNHRLHAAHGHLLELAGDPEGARTAYRLAAGLTHSIPEQRYLNRRARD
ncbi:MAG: RNA polymerase sigma factor [Nocardioidaceae bacterium]